MDLKKNLKYDLESKRLILFQVGLLVAGSFTLAAFTYKKEALITLEKKMVAEHSINFSEEFIPEKKIEIKPIIQSNQKETNETVIDLTINPDENSEFSENKNESFDPKLAFDDLGYKIGKHVVIEQDLVLKGEVFDITDKDASFIGGNIEMQKFINEKIVFPEDAKKFGDQGTVYVSFVVEPDGSITNVSIERGVSYSIDSEAKRVVRAFPKWNPGEVNFKPVRTRVRLPITFEIKEN